MFCVLDFVRSNSDGEWTLFFFSCGLLSGVMRLHASMRACKYGIVCSSMIGRDFQLFFLPGLIDSFGSDASTGKFRLYE